MRKDGLQAGGFLIEILFAFSGLQPDGRLGCPNSTEVLQSASTENTPDPSDVKVNYTVITEIYDPFPCTSWYANSAPLFVIEL